MNRSTPSLPVHHHLLEFTQTHVHRVRDAIQPSHPLSSPFPLAPNPSQHQGLFQWVNSSHEVAKGLEFQLQHHSLQRNPRADCLQNGLLGSQGSHRLWETNQRVLEFFREIWILILLFNLFLFFTALFTYIYNYLLTWVGPTLKLNLWSSICSENT